MTDQTRKRAKAVGAYCLVGVMFFGVAQCRRTHEGVAATGPVVTPSSTVPAPTTTKAAATTSTVASKPTTTTIEAVPHPTTTAVVADVSAVTVGFLTAWVLRQGIDERHAALAPYTSPGYADAVAFADPDVLPAGTAIVVNNVASNGATAAVAAQVDGITVQVNLVATGAGWRVVSHQAA